MTSQVKDERAMKLDLNSELSAIRDGVARMLTWDTGDMAYEQCSTMWTLCCDIQAAMDKFDARRARRPLYLVSRR